MGDDPQLVAVYDDSTKAELARQKLEDYDIVSFVTGKNVSDVYSGLVSFALTELRTKPSDVKRAKEILTNSDVAEDKD
jgi:hypothetical protein